MGPCAIGYALEHSEGEMIIFQKEDGSPGGVGAYLLNKLRLALPGETLEPVSTLYTVLIPPCFLARKAADDWVGFPKGWGLGSRNLLTQEARRDKNIVYHLRTERSCTIYWMKARIATHRLQGMFTRVSF